MSASAALPAAMPAPAAPRSKFEASAEQVGWRPLAWSSIVHEASELRSAR